MGEIKVSVLKQPSDPMRSNTSPIWGAESIVGGNPVHN